MVHLPGFAAARPVDVPILVGANGPKGLAVAAEVADGILTLPPLPDVMGGASAPAREAEQQWPWHVMGALAGTLLDDDEDVASDRVLNAAGHTVAFAYHGIYTVGGADAIDAMPGGREWREAIEAYPPEERHVFIHEGHLCAMTDRDRAAVRQAAPMVRAVGFTGTASELRAKVEAYAATGATELVYQPAGPDIPGELERMAGALGI